MAENNDAKDDMSEDELDQIIQDMSKEEEEVAAEPAAKPVLELVQAKKSATPPIAAPAPAPTTSGKVDQALTLELSGVINLKLCFTNGERSIEVLCTEEALVCKMADGTEFRIPTGISKARKAA